MMIVLINFLVSASYFVLFSITMLMVIVLALAIATSLTLLFYSVVIDKYFSDNQKIIWFSFGVGVLIFLVICVKVWIYLPNQLAYRHQLMRMFGYQNTTLVFTFNTLSDAEKNKVVALLMPLMTRSARVMENRVYEGGGRGGSSRYSHTEYEYIETEYYWYKSMSDTTNQQQLFIHTGAPINENHLYALFMQLQQKQIMPLEQLNGFITSSFIEMKRCGTVWCITFNPLIEGLGTVAPLTFAHVAPEKLTSLFKSPLVVEPSDTELALLDPVFNQLRSLNAELVYAYKPAFEFFKGNTRVTPNLNVTLKDSDRKCEFISNLWLDDYRLKYPTKTFYDDYLSDAEKEKRKPIISVERYAEIKKVSELRFNCRYK